MKNGYLISIFASLLGLWAYWFPYQWWIKYGPSDEDRIVAASDREPKETRPSLPAPFLGTSLLDSKPVTDSVVVTKAPSPVGGADLASPILDEMKICFGEGPVASLSVGGGGDLGQLVSTLQSQLGPVRDDVLLEKKILLKLKDGSSRTLVYEWISPEEGSDVYWHDTDTEGFPRPVDLPPGSGHDLATFEQLRQLGTPAGKLTESRLIELSNEMQLGLDKADDQIQSLTLKDEAHLIKCRRDPVKSFLCDCLN